MNDRLESRKASDEQRQDAMMAGVQGPKARQGAISGRIRKVVIVSTTLAAAAMLGTWWYFVA